MPDPSSDDFDAAVGQVYAAATGDVSWEHALDAAIRATGFDGAALYVLGPDGATLSAGTPSLSRGLWRNLNPEGQDDYARHWFKCDPRVQYMLANPQQRIFHDYLHTSEAEIDRHPYYDWYLRQQETRYYVGGQTDPKLPFLAGLTLHRRGRLGAAEPADVQRFARLFAHIQRALDVEFRLHSAGNAAAGFETLVECNSGGVVLLDQGGRVLHANEAARAMAARADAFTLGSRLRALRPAEDSLLQRMVTNVAAVASGGSPPPALRLPRRTGQLDYVIVATPVTPGAGLFQPWSAAVCVLIADPEAAPRLPETVLREAFGLTGAEARLLARLATGCTVEQAADGLQVTQATVRTQLAALFRKTGTNRQAELMRLVLALPWQAIGGARS